MHRSRHEILTPNCGMTYILAPSTSSLFLALFAYGQVRRTISWKSFLFNLSFENKRVRKIFGGGMM